MRFNETIFYGQFVSEEKSVELSSQLEVREPGTLSPFLAHVLGWCMVRWVTKSDIPNPDFGKGLRGIVGIMMKEAHYKKVQRVLYTKFGAAFFFLLDLTYYAGMGILRRVSRVKNKKS